MCALAFFYRAFFVTSSAVSTLFVATTTVRACTKPASKSVESCFALSTTTGSPSPTRSSDHPRKNTNPQISSPFFSDRQRQTPSGPVAKTVLRESRNAASSCLRILVGPVAGVNAVLVDSQPFAPSLQPGRLALCDSPSYTGLPANFRARRVGSPPATSFLASLFTPARIIQAKYAVQPAAPRAVLAKENFACLTRLHRKR
jgi:hypothetical protein